MLNNCRLKQIIASLLLGALLLCVSCGNRGLTVAQAKQELQAIYAEMDKGLENKNAQQAVSHTAPDFVCTSASGQRQTAAELSKDLGGLFFHGSKIHSKQTITDFKLDGNRATLTVSSDVTYDAINTTRNPVAGQSASFEDKGESVDVWTKESDGWECHSTRSSGATSTVNGQPETE